MCKKNRTCKRTEKEDKIFKKQHLQEGRCLQLRHMCKKNRTCKRTEKEDKIFKKQHLQEGRCLQLRQYV